MGRPGVSVVELAESLEVTHQTISYHLGYLKRAGLLLDFEQGNRRLAFANGTGFKKCDRGAVAALRHPRAMEIVRFVAEKPGVRRSELASRLRLNRSVAAWHVGNLVAAGLILETGCEKTRQLVLNHGLLHRARKGVRSEPTIGSFALSHVSDGTTVAESEASRGLVEAQTAGADNDAPGGS